MRQRGIVIENAATFIPHARFRLLKPIKSIVCQLQSPRVFLKIRRLRASTAVLKLLSAANGFLISCGVLTAVGIMKPISQAYAGWSQHDKTLSSNRQLCFSEEFAMISSLLTLAVSAFSPDGVSTPDLFSKLDKNADGKVSQSEMSGPQQPMFKRALRVADANEDGALNKDEFAKAVSDPKPVELPGANMGDRMASFDVGRLDRNGDGNVSLDEVPGPMRERFEELLDRIGQDSVPVDKVQAYLRGERPGTQPADRESEEMMDADKDRMKKDDPKVEPKSTSSKPSAGKSGTGKPGAEKSGAKKSGDRKRNPNSPMENAGPAAIFKQLDRNSDGKLTGNEIPPRMQENIKAADTDNDGSISQSEMQSAFQRRMQNQKK